MPDIKEYHLASDGSKLQGLVSCNKRRGLRKALITIDNYRLGWKEK